MPDKVDMNRVRENVRAARRYYRMEVGLEAMERSNSEVTSINIRLGDGAGKEPLVVVKGRDGDGRPVIAFSAGSTAMSALETALERFSNNTLKWREDKPYVPQ